MNTRDKIILLALLSAWLVTPIESYAAHVRELNLAQMVDRSQLITHAHVLSVQAQRSEQNPKRIVTVVTVVMQRVFRQDRGQLAGITEQFVIPGGQVGRYAQRVSGTPRFHVGQEVILLLQRHPTLDWLMPVGLSQGRYVVERPPQSSPLAMQDRRGLIRMQPQTTKPWTQTTEPAVDRQPLVDLLGQLERLVKRP